MQKSQLQLQQQVGLCLNVRMLQICYACAMATAVAAAAAAATALPASLLTLHIFESKRAQLLFAPLNRFSNFVIHNATVSVTLSISVSVSVSATVSVTATRRQVAVAFSGPAMRPTGRHVFVRVASVSSF